MESRVFLTASALVGVDFGPPGDLAPQNWTHDSGGATHTLSNLIDESGAVTSIDLTVTGTGGGVGYLNFSPPPPQIPSHANSLAEIGGNIGNGVSITLTFSDLAPGGSYELFVFGGDGTDDTQTVTISGGNSPVSFVQTILPGQLWINTGVGTNASLDSFAYSQVADANGRIVVQITETNVASNAVVPAIAIRQMVGSGTVTGALFDDGNGNGAHDVTEGALEGWIVYADLDRDGQRDQDEPFATTDITGHYSLSLDPGSYVIREERPAGWSQTTPAPRLFATGNDGNVVIEFDPLAGTATVIGAAGIPSTYAAAFTPDGTLWTITRAGFNGSSQLAKIDLATGVATPVGPPDANAFSVVGLESDASGVLYATSQSNSNLYRVDTSTGAFTLVGHMQTIIGELDFDNTGTLWGVSNNNQLFRINPLTAQITFVANITGVSGQVYSLMTDPRTNVLYASTWADSTALYTIDRTTGVATQVGPALATTSRVVGGDFQPLSALGYAVTIAPGVAIDGKDFGNRQLPPTVITGTKFNDLDGDGQFDPGEPGLVGWTVYADLNHDGDRDAGEPFAVTDSSGNYALNVDPGTYLIREEHQAGWSATTPSPRLFATGNDGSAIIEVDPIAGTATVLSPTGYPATYAAAFTPDGTLWTITRAFTTGASQLAKVDVNTGFLTPVGSPDPAANTVIALEADSSGTLYAASLATGSLYRVNTTSGAFTLIGTLGTDIRDLDFDNNGVLWGTNSNNALFRINPNTAQITFVATITGVPGPVMSLMTDSRTGVLYASVYGNPAALYTVNRTTGVATIVGGGLAPFFGIVGGDFQPETATGRAVTIASGMQIGGQNFGAVTLPQSTVSGKKFNDLDGDGVLDSGETGLAGWVIYADLNRDGDRDPNEPFAITGSDGQYTLTFDPGNYLIREEHQAGWTQTSPAPRLFATGNDGTLLIELDPATGGVTAIGPTGFGSTYAAAFTPDGTLWTIKQAFVGGASQLAKVNLATGALTLVGSPDSNATPAIALEADAAGTLYAANFSNGNLYRVNTTTGAFTIVGNIGTDIRDLDFDNNGVLWGTNFGNQLFIIDPNTALKTFVSQISGVNGPVMSLMTDPRTGQLYASVWNSPAALYSIDRATGAATQIGPGFPTIYRLVGGDFQPPSSTGYELALTGGVSYVGKDFGDKALPSPSTALVGVDFGPPGDPAPFHWNHDTGGAAHTLSQLVDETGTPTPISLTITGTGGGAGVGTFAPAPPDIPAHDIDLAAIAGNLGNGTSLTLTFSGLTAGAVYRLYVFGGDSIANVQTVSINGGNLPVSFVQSNVGGQLIVNGRPGSNSGLDSFAVVQAADASGRIVIQINEAFPGANAVVSAVALQLVSGSDPGTISGRQYHDLNRNGLFDAGEPTLSGWVVYADLDQDGRRDDGEPFAVTDFSGQYTLTLAPGSYSLREENQSDWIRTTPGGRLFALRGNGATPTIFELDPHSPGTVLNSFNLPPFAGGFAGPQGLAVGPHSLFYIDSSGNGPYTLYELDPSTGAVIDSDPIAANSPIAGLGYMNGKVYIELYSTDQILVFDPSSDTVVNTLNVSADLVGGLAAAPDRNLLYDSNFAGQIIAINPDTGAVVNIFYPGVGGFGAGLAYVNGELIAAQNAASPTAYRIDPSTGAVIAPIILGGSGVPSGLGGDGDGLYGVIVLPGEQVVGRDFGVYTFVNHPPAGDPATFTIPENSPAGTLVGTVTAADPDGSPLHFQITSGNDTNAFAIDPFAGTLTVANEAPLDFETAPSFQLVVTVSDGALAHDIDVTVNLSDVNDPPTAVNLVYPTSTLEENSDTSVRVSLGEIVVTDDALGTTSLGLDGDDAAFFEIDAGFLYLKAHTALNYEDKSSYRVTIVVDDTSVGTTPDLTLPFTLNVADLNEPPTAVLLTNPVVWLNENTPTTSRIRLTDIQAVDDALGTNLLGLDGADSGLFEIDAGVLYLKAGASLDFESKDSYSVEIRIDDPNVGTAPDAATSFSLNINDLNEAPTRIVLDNPVKSLPEDADTSDRIRIGAITVDDDALGTNELGVGGEDGAAFQIENGVLYLKLGIHLDFESRNTYSVTLVADDTAVGATPDATCEFVLSITDVNEPPTGIVLTDPIVPLDENTSTTTRLRLTDIQAIDDALGNNLLSLDGPDSGLFEIDAGVVYLKAGASLDFESKSSYTVSVRVDDPDVGSVPDAATDFTLNINDVNEPPTGIGLDNPVTSLPEDADTSARILIGVITVDDDALGANGFSLGGDDAAAFEIDNGVLYLSSGTSLNYETKSSYSVTLIADDTEVGATPDATFAFVLSITGVNETPTDIGLDPSTVDENQPAGTRVGDLSTSDPDQNNSFTYSLADGDGDDDNGAFTIVSGELRTADEFNFETKASYSIRVRSTDQDGLWTEKAFTIAVSDVNEPPTAVQPRNVIANISENTDTSTRIRLADLHAADDALGTNVFTIAGIDKAAFEIEGTTLYLRARTPLDFESKSSYSVTIEVDDAAVGSTPDASTPFTLTIIDSNEAPTAVSFTNVVDSLPENTSTAARIRLADIGIADDALGTNVLSLGGADFGAFELDGSTLYLKAGVILNYETKTSFVIMVNVNDAAVGGAPDASKDFTLSVSDVNEAPTGISLVNAASSLPENSDTSSRVKVVDIQVADDALGSNVLALGGADAGRFEIVSNALYLRSGTSLDFEAKASYAVTVMVDDAEVGASPDASTSLTLAITDVNEPPRVQLANISTTTLAENASTATARRIADIIVTDDALGTRPLALSGADAAMFQITGTQLFLKAGVELDFETNPSLDVTVEVDDPAVGTTPDSSASVTIGVTNVSEALPVIGKFGSTVTFTENGAAALISTTATITDSDSPNFNNGFLKVELTANGEANDRLSIRSQGTGAGQIGVSGSNVTFGGTVIGTLAGGVGTAPLVITFNAACTPTAAQALLRNVTFSNVSNNPVTASRTLRVSLADGDTGTTTGTPVTKSITVKAVNNAPTLGGFSGSVPYTRGGAPALIGGGATVTDPDSPNFSGGKLTVQLSNNAQSADRLTIQNQGTGAGQIGVSGSNVTYGGVIIGTFKGGTGSTALVITLNANANATSVAALLNSIQFSTTSTSTLTRTVRATLTDGDGGTGSAVTKSISVA